MNKEQILDPEAYKAKKIEESKEKEGREVEEKDL